MILLDGDALWVTSAHAGEEIAETSLTRVGTNPPCRPSHTRSRSAPAPIDRSGGLRSRATRRVGRIDIPRNSQHRHEPGRCLDELFQLVRQLVTHVSTWGRDGDGEMRHTIVEAVQEVSDNWFDDCRIDVLAGECLDGVNRLPDSGDDDLALIIY